MPKAGLTSGGLARTLNKYGGPAEEPTDIGLSILAALKQLDVENHNQSYGKNSPASNLSLYQSLEHSQQVLEVSTTVGASQFA
jgi:hypothetical protein